MRGAIAAMLAGLGAFLVVCAILLPTWVTSQTYMVFDTNTGKDQPYVYSGTTTVHGITVYKFIDNVAPTLVSTLSIPGSLVGSKDASVKMGEFDGAVPAAATGE